VPALSSTTKFLNKSGLQIAIRMEEFDLFWKVTMACPKPKYRAVTTCGKGQITSVINKLIKGIHR